MVKQLDAPPLHRLHQDLAVLHWRTLIVSLAVGLGADRAWNWWADIHTFEEIATPDSVGVTSAVLAHLAVVALTVAMASGVACAVYGVRAAYERHADPLYRSRRGLW